VGSGIEVVVVVVVVVVVGGKATQCFMEEGLS